MGLCGQGDGRAEGGAPEARLGHAAVAPAAEEGARLRRLPPPKAVCPPDLASVRTEEGRGFCLCMLTCLDYVSNYTYLYLVLVNLTLTLTSATNLQYKSSVLSFILAPKHLFSSSVLTMIYAYRPTFREATE